MVIFMKVSSKIIKFMDLDGLFGQMGQFTRDFGKMESNMVRANLEMPMGQFLKENGKIMIYAISYKPNKQILKKMKIMTMKINFKCSSMILNRNKFLNLIKLQIIIAKLTLNFKHQFLLNNHYKINL